MHFFVSDAHIRTDQSERAQNFIRFLSEKKKEFTDLYILGDLFEFWFEYGVVVPKNYFRVLATLHNLIQEDKRVHYFLGNHEVMIGKFLTNLGFRLYTEETRLVIDGRRILIGHGHRVDHRLWSSFWSGLMNSPMNRLLYRFLHPDFGVFLAQIIAHQSRRQKRSSSIQCMLESYARHRLKEPELDIVMLAHSHQPVIQEPLPGKFYVNTGDWVSHFSYAVMDQGKIKLEYYRK